MIISMMTHKPNNLGQICLLSYLMLSEFVIRCVHAGSLYRAYV